MEFKLTPPTLDDGSTWSSVPRRFYAQVIKTRRHDRVVRVDRRAVIGAAWRFDEALTHSEDSSTVNTSFIERLNLTIRQSSAYLSRRTLSHARATDTLDAHLELLRCYYNFGTAASGAEFGRETRTPGDAGRTCHAAADASGHLRVRTARCLVAERRAGRSLTCVGRQLPLSCTCRSQRNNT